MKIKNNLSFFIIVTLLIGLTTCKKESIQHGFYLQRFEVLNPQLKAVIQGIKDSIYINNGLGTEKKVSIMVLRVYDSIPEFCFTSTDIDEVSTMYIFKDSRRIVGYIDLDDSPLIVLSSVSSQYEFVNVFYKFLIPTENTKRFEYIYFPDNLYCLPDENGIPCPPLLFDPYYYAYAFKDGRFVFMSNDE
jgi:hypothetical protein